MARRSRIGCLIPALLLGTVASGFAYAMTRDGLSTGDYVLGLIIFMIVGFVYADISRKKGQ